jgi:hypothetical protein
MTKKQAINGLKDNLCSLCAYGSQNMDSCDIRECDNRDYIKALEQQPSEVCVSREAVFEAIDDCNSDGLKGIFCSYEDGERFKEYIKKLSPTCGTCKDCKHLCDWHNRRSKGLYCGLHTEEDFCFEVEENFYCAYFEKRGDENESISN